jgi:hypothetical protein
LRWQALLKVPGVDDICSIVIMRELRAFIGLPV